MSDSDEEEEKGKVDDPTSCWWFFFFSSFEHGSGRFLFLFSSFLFFLQARVVHNCLPSRLHDRHSVIVHRQTAPSFFFIFFCLSHWLVIFLSYCYKLPSPMSMFMFYDLRLRSKTIFFFSLLLLLFFFLFIFCLFLPFLFDPSIHPCYISSSTCCRRFLFFFCSPFHVQPSSPPSSTHLITCYRRTKSTHKHSHAAGFWYVFFK